MRLRIQNTAFDGRGRSERMFMTIALAAMFALLAPMVSHAQPVPRSSDGIIMNRRDCEAWRQTAYRALQSGNYDEAVRRYSNVNARGCPGAEMEIAFNRGMAYHHLGRFEEAMRDFDIAVTFDPNDRHTSAVLHNNRCYSLTALDRAAEALPDCDKAVSPSPRANELYLSTRGFAYSRLGRFEEALRDFDAALKSDPKKADALYSRGVIKLRLGLPGGDADIAAARAIDPNIGRPAQ